MFILQVTPLTTRGLDRLSYFSVQKTPVGAIVHVPIRGRKVPALVLEREDARTIKAILRTSIYETKKIDPAKPFFAFSPEFMRAAQKTATYFATSTGSIITSYVPAAILDAGQKGVLARPSPQRKDTGTREQLVLQLPRDERFEKYKIIIRSTFARGTSVFLCAPTVREAHSFKEYYGRGIEQYTYVLTSSQSKKLQVDTWNAILNEDHPVLIIATPTFASIPRMDVGMYIIEREVSSSYTQQRHPHADARILFEHLAHETDSALVHAGTTVSLRVHKNLQEESATELEEHSKTLRSSVALTLIDSKDVRKRAKDTKQEFPSLSPETLEMLSVCQKKGEHAFVFAARRGIAAHTVCNDCAATVACHQCGAPLVLHEKGSSRTLLCHRCGASRDAHETCALCGSWNLVPLGIGIERIDQYIRSQLPDATTFVVSSDTARTPKQSQQIVDTFYATRGGILVGTEMALPYLSEKIDCAAMSSIDSLLCVPNFQIEEKIFGIIATLREYVKRELILETSNPENAMLKHAKSGTISKYANEELALRKKLHYPPYTNLIKVTSCGSRNSVIGDMRTFVKRVEKYTPRVFSGFISGKRGRCLHALIRVPSNAWPDEDLIKIFRGLPATFEVHVDPNRTL